VALPLVSSLMTNSFAELQEVPSMGDSISEGLVQEFVAGKLTWSLMVLRCWNHG